MAYQSMPIESQASLAELMFSATSGPVNVSVNSYYSFQLINPPNSGKTALLNLVESDTEETTELIMYKNTTSFVSIGSLLPVNTNAGSTQTSPIIINFSGDIASSPVTGGTLMYYFINQSNVVKEKFFRGGIAIPPSSDIVFSVLNQNPSAIELSINFNWWEVDIGFV